MKNEILKISELVLEEIDEDEARMFRSSGEGMYDTYISEGIPKEKGLGFGEGGVGLSFLSVVLFRYAFEQLDKNEPAAPSDIERYFADNQKIILKKLKKLFRADCEIESKKIFAGLATVIEKNLLSEEKSVQLSNLDTNETSMNSLSSTVDEADDIFFRGAPSEDFRIVNSRVSGHVKSAEAFDFFKSHSEEEFRVKYGDSYAERKLKIYRAMSKEEK